MSKQTDTHHEPASEIGWRYYVQSLDDELAHIEDTLRTESFVFDIEHVAYDCLCPGKRCSRCDLIKCHGCFNIDKSRKDNLNLFCRTCRSDQRKIYKKPVDSQLVEPVQQHATSGCTCPGKRCNRCEQVKCHGFFYKSTVVKSGLVGRCRVCISMVGKAQRDSDRTGYNAKDRAQRQRMLQSEQGEVFLQKESERNRKFRENHREYFRRYDEEYGRVRVEKRRARKMQASGSFTSQEWEALKIRYNYTCLCCGKREPEIRLTADHIVPLSRGGDNAIENIQPLCRPCNSAKGVKTIDYRTEAKRHA